MALMEPINGAMIKPWLETVKSASCCFSPPARITRLMTSFDPIRYVLGSPRHKEEIRVKDQEEQEEDKRSTDRACLWFHHYDLVIIGGLRKRHDIETSSPRDLWVLDSNS